MLFPAINLSCREPSCQKHEVIKRYIHLGTAGSPTAVKTLSFLTFAKPKEIDDKL